MKTLYTILLITLVNAYVQAQKAPHNLFVGKAILDENIEIPTRKAAYFDFDVQSFRQEVKAVSGRQASAIVLPLPDGSFEEFEVKESQVMSPELAAKFPNIKTYSGVSTKNGYSSVRFDISPKGFHAMLFTPNGTVYIDPVNRQNSRDYQSYYKRDFLSGHKDVFQEKELFGSNSALASQINLLQPQSAARPSGSELRTYRLAVAATGEYTAFHGGTVAGALAAIVTTMNRVNGIYEREVSIRMVLVGNTNELIFTDAATDGFSNSDARAFIDEVQAKIDDIIGDADYDIGHGVSTGGGGLAGTGPCITGRKASGITGSSQPIGDPYDVDFVAHEIGHQFSAAHTFNGSSGSCTSNRSASSAYEPGSGTTIMAYAGICSPQNIQNNSDAYFHSQSFDQIIAYSTVGSGNTCATVSSTGNNAPVVEAGEGGFTIPISTPFKLDGSATDPDGDDLTYSWEQFDLGPAGAPESPVDNAPLFRAFSPVSESYRLFPQISDIVENSNTMGEILPDYTRSLKFRLTARDNKDGGGGVDYDEINFDVSDEAGPFVVTEPNTNVDLTALTTTTITWDVANTNVAPINCQSVNILLSTDGGLTFPTTLISNTNNDGAVVVLIPSITTSEARIKVEAADNIFFDISDANFSISVPVEDDFSVYVDTEVLEVCSPDAAVYNVQVSEIGNFTTPVTLSVTGLPAGYNTAFDTNPIIPGNTTLLTISNTASESGIFDLEVKGEAGSKVHTQDVRLIVLNGAPDKVNLQTPSDNDVGVLLTPVLTWDAIDGASSYDVQLSTDIDFVSIIEEKNVINEVNYSVTNKLNGSSQYFWRVKAINFCGIGDYSEVNSFNTLETVCDNVDYTGNSVQISSSGTPTITSTIEIASNGTINDVNVKDIKGLHTYIEDLVVTLISPTGTEVTLFSAICGDNDDFDLSFDDDSSTSTISCPPTDQGVYSPQELLSAFNQEQSQGVWTLRIEDTANLDGGQLDGWTLEVCTNKTGENKPTELVATVNSSSEIQLVWVDNALNETGYRVYRSTAGSEFIELVSLGVDIESYTDTGLDANTMYSYRLSAYNSGGDSEFALAEATTFDTPPLAPVDLEAENTITEIALSWEDVADNEAEFVVERSIGDNLNFVAISTVSSNVVSYVDTDIVYGILYTYRVFASNNGGNSDYSNEVISDLVTGLSSKKLLDQINIYPNPNQGVFQLSLAGGQLGVYEVQVTNLVGKTIQEIVLEKSSATLEYSFDLSDQPKGVYLIRISNKDGASTHRIVKY